MEEWKIYRLGDLVDFQNGYAFKSSKFLYDGKYKIIRIKELKNGLVKFFEDTVSISDEPNEILSKILVNKGDVIFALTGDPVSKQNANSWVGRVSLYTHDIPAYLNQRTCKIIQCNNVVPQYVYYYFRQYENLYSLASKATGSASQANISTKILEDTEILLPSLSVQEKMVAILASLDNKIALNRRINDNLEQQAQAMFKSWFVENASYSGVSISEYFLPNRGKNLLVSDAKGGKTPVVAGGLTPSAFHNVANTKAPVITISASGANAGFVNLWGIPVWAADSSYIDSTIVSYIYFWYNLLKYNQKNIYESQTGSAQPHIYPKHIGNLLIPDLDMRKVKCYESIVTSMYLQINEIQQETKLLTDLRDTLLPKLMSGELKINDLNC
ncbi:restriction endonuclease subunit S [Phocaeicola sp.]|uniref:restriction endonuclease subunit S n=1 Tax=Phocaeicola sp. TaxID=2773926 RepID=UPI0027D24047|nr:restriction endonuclease subunit S [Phocaeicola sp.]